MKFKSKINSGQIGRNSSRRERKAEKKRYSKLFRKVGKEAIKKGFYDLVPVRGKFHGWAD